jgi:hypothetical protein
MRRPQSEIYACKSTVGNGENLAAGVGNYCHWESRCGLQDMRRKKAATEVNDID